MVSPTIYKQFMINTRWEGSVMCSRDKRFYDDPSATFATPVSSGGFATNVSVPLLPSQPPQSSARQLPLSPKVSQHHLSCPKLSSTPCQLTSVPYPCLSQIQPWWTPKPPSHHLAQEHMFLFLLLRKTSHPVDDLRLCKPVF